MITLCASYELHPEVVIRVCRIIEQNATWVWNVKNLLLRKLFCQNALKKCILCV